MEVGWDLAEERRNDREIGKNVRSELGKKEVIKRVGREGGSVERERGEEGRFGRGRDCGGREKV